jgi:hypothetical protein
MLILLFCAMDAFICCLLMISCPVLCDSVDGHGLRQGNGSKEAVNNFERKAAALDDDISLQHELPD